MIYGIDPGTELSAMVLYDNHTKAPLISLRHGLSYTYRWTLPNDELLLLIKSEGAANWQNHELVIEEFQSFGMAVGNESLRTVWWSGRFYEAWQGHGHAFMLPRKAVKSHLCGSTRATDANIRHAIIDGFGGKVKAIGNKKNPGPLYGIKGHEFAALGVALTHAGDYGA